MVNIKDNSGAAIVCAHVAKLNYPILMAQKDEPINNADSGWQFLCNTGLDENYEEAQTWSINEILIIEPSLSSYMDQPAGTVLLRKNKESAWVIHKP